MLEGKQGNNQKCSHKILKYKDDKVDIYKDSNNDICPTQFEAIKISTHNSLNAKRVCLGIMGRLSCQLLLYK